MARASPTVIPGPGAEVEAADQQVVQGREGSRNQMGVPEDGHQWKKYGQKFIKGINKIRCYFKCRRPGCRAKKRVEWPPRDPGNVRVLYEGAHEHLAPQPGATSEQDPSSSGAGANQYDLATQVFGAH